MIYLKRGLLLMFLLWLAGCTDTAPPSDSTLQTAIVVSPMVTPTPQPAATATLPPTPTPTIEPTSTPLPTPTATATAVSAQLFGNPNIYRLTNTPEPAGGAPCGLVDIFDFPIDPPDAANVSRGGGDFGIFRERFGKYHAGEDWGAPGAGSNFGKPVYSVGHGRVMYAEPEGWNRDKGVVIVEHVVQTPAERQVIYSFYGHLDPPSVLLEPGDCVRRGEHLGNIGKPRTSPHLHFEMRTHMPYAPGPGYWEEDPTTAGWLPPSQTIWNQRLVSSPGVSWLRPFAPTGSQPLGLWRDDAFLTIENGRLTTTNLENGSSQPSPLTYAEIESGLLHEQNKTLFLVTPEGLLQAFADELLWEFELAGNGRSTLLPLPGGGVMAVRGIEALGLSGDGDVLWRMEMGKRPFAWTLTADHLVYTAAAEENGTWVVAGTDPPAPMAHETGYPVALGEKVWLYAADGLYELHPESEASLIYPLPPANLRLSHITALPDGGALVAHTDAYDRRLIAFNRDGELRWDVSIAHLIGGKAQLVVTDDQVLLAVQNSAEAQFQMPLYLVNPATGDLNHLFSGGSRASAYNDVWLLPAAAQIVVNSAGGAILALHPVQAAAAITAASPTN
ncbi:MAG: M23 family metallopeptidase [Chloroflexota bacterium]